MITNRGDPPPTVGGVAHLLLCGVAAIACLAAACGLEVSGLGSPATDGGGTDATQEAAGGGGAEGAPLGDDASSLDAPVADSTSEAPGTDSPAETGSVVDGSTDSPVQDVASEGPATCTLCLALTCCRNGGCSPVGTQTCGDPGQECFDCTNAPTGNQCIALLGHEVCGCAGPGNQDQCPPLTSCHGQQCDTACDGQHPCNGGCCSGDDLATSRCVTACGAGESCQGNYCQ